MSGPDYAYIIVGSGAAGTTIAAKCSRRAPIRRFSCSKRVPKSP
jgi:choline dehydrogenase-like flavoprotein